MTKTLQSHCFGTSRLRHSVRCTDMRRLTTGICSEKCVVRRFRRCANIIECTYTNLDSIANYTSRLYGIAYCRPAYYRGQQIRFWTVGVRKKNYQRNRSVPCSYKIPCIIRILPLTFSLPTPKVTAINWNLQKKNYRGARRYKEETEPTIEAWKLRENRRTGDISFEIPDHSQK